MKNVENKELIRVLIIADPHEIIHIGIKCILGNKFTNMEFSSVFSGHEVMNILNGNKFDLLIIDPSLPVNDSISCIKQILAIKNKPKTLVYSFMKEESFGLKLVKTGIQGYLYKLSKSEELICAIEKILNGSKYISEKMKELIAEEFMGTNQIKGFALLSERELQILKYLNNGISGNKLCKLLELRPSTIGTHKNRIFNKLGVTNLIELHNLYDREMLLQHIVEI